MRLLRTRDITLTRRLGLNGCGTPAPYSERRRFGVIPQGWHASYVWMSFIYACFGNSFNGLCDRRTVVVSVSAVVGKGCAGGRGHGGVV